MLTLLSSIVLFGVFHILCFGFQLALYGAFPLKGQEAWSLARPLSLAIIAFWGWLCYVFTIPNYAAFAVPVVLMLLFLFRQRKQSLENIPLHLNLLQGFVSFGVFALLCGVGSFSGGGWAADWVEHFERTKNILERASPDLRVLSDAYHITARPPLGNSLPAYFLIPFEASFSQFQVIMAFLGAELLWGMFLFISIFKPITRLPYQVAASLCLLSPVFLQNAVFPWTKSISSLFTISAIACLYGYLKGQGSRQLTWFGLLLAVGILAHYSAAVFLPGAALILAWRAWLDRESLRIRGVISAYGPGALIGFIIIGAWLFWAIYQFGLKTPFQSTTTISYATESNLVEVLIRISTNIYNSVIPPYFREVSEYAWNITHGKHPLIFIRDLFFNLFQGNALFFGGFSVLFIYPLLSISKKFRLSPEIKFKELVFFYGSSFILGIAVAGAVDEIGLMHLCLQPLLYLSIGYIALLFGRFSRPLKCFLGLTLAATLAVGIGIHFYILNWTPHDWVLLLQSGDRIHSLALESGFAAYANINSQVQGNFEFLGTASNLPFGTTFGAYLLMLGLTLRLLVKETLRLPSMTSESKIN